MDEPPIPSRPRSDLDDQDKLRSAGASPLGPGPSQAGQQCVLLRRGNRGKHNFKVHSKIPLISFEVDEARGGEEGRLLAVVSAQVASEPQCSDTGRRQPNERVRLSGSNCNLQEIFRSEAGYDCLPVLGIWEC